MHSGLGHVKGGAGKGKSRFLWGSQGLHLPGSGCNECLSLSFDLKNSTHQLSVKQTKFPHSHPSLERKSVNIGCFEFAEFWLFIPDVNWQGIFFFLNLFIYLANTEPQQFTLQYCFKVSSWAVFLSLQWDQGRARCLTKGTSNGK